MKKLLALLLVLCFVIGFLPTRAHAEEHPYKGKVISILGDSISTFAGYIPTADGFNLEHLSVYPQGYLLTDVNETWWMQVITQTGAYLGINDSWSGSSICGKKDGEEYSCMANIIRIRNLGSNGTPDVIFFYGGTNDLAQGIDLGQFDPAQAQQSVDLQTYKWNNIADGYVNTLLRLKFFYPKAQIICMLPTYTRYFYTETQLARCNELLAVICEYYGVPYVDLRYCGVSLQDMLDGVHPNANGMDYITEAVMERLAECPIKSGENVVHSVTHDLINAKSSLGYLKGITRGESFSAQITGKNVDVRVIMRGKDITQSCYSGSVIWIPKITGDLYVIAHGEGAYAEHLVKLPQYFCGETNLWPLLEHHEEYFGANGWEVHPSGEVYSVTVPILPGERLWATSFQAAGTNGGSINGIRMAWFAENELLKAVDSASVYREFSANGYITAPENATAVNVVMWNTDETNEFYIRSREHCYQNGICMGCGKYDLSKDLHLSAAVTVGAAMNIVYTIAADDMSKYIDYILTVRHASSDGEPITRTYNLREMTAMNHPVSGKAMMYYVSYKDMAAKEMGDEFTATLYAIDHNAVVSYGPSVTSSVKQTLLDKFDEPTTTDQWRTMAVDMLKYGAAAQIHFDYDTEHLVTADLTKQQLAFATSKVPSAVDRIAFSGEGANISADITLGARVELNLSCIAMGVTDPSAVKCVITDENGELIAKIDTENKANVMFSAVYDDVGAKQMRKLIRAAFYEGDRQISQSVTWSVESYVAKIRRSTESTLSELRMVNAMLVYGDSVAAYLENINRSGSRYDCPI